MAYAPTLRLNGSKMVTINIRTDFTIEDMAGMFIAVNNGWDSFDESQALMDERIRGIMAGLKKKDVVDSVKEYVESHGVYSCWDEKIRRVDSVFIYALSQITELFES